MVCRQLLHVLATSGEGYRVISNTCQPDKSRTWPGGLRSQVSQSGITCFLKRLILYLVYLEKCEKIDELQLLALSACSP